MSRRSTRPLLLPLLLAGCVLLGGCAGTDPDAAAGSTSGVRTSSSTSGPSPTSTASAASAAAGQRIEVTVAGGQVSGDTGRVPVPAGGAVTLSITSDVADEVHVHGYDLTTELTPGTPAELTFDAIIPGVFEVELHDAGTVLLTLQVQ